MSGNTRHRILSLMRIFHDQTDENHTLTLPEIQHELSKYGISADRRVIYDDIEELCNAGQEIIREATGKRGYFLSCRLFEDPEISIIADSIRASYFLSEQKTERLLNKLAALSSPQYRSKLTRKVFMATRPKDGNSSVLYQVDLISQAIMERRAVSFYPYRLNCKRRREFYLGDTPVIVYPEMLIRDKDNYYMIAATQEWQHVHYRIDRMTDIELLDSFMDDDNGQNMETLRNYVKTTFGMEPGAPVKITLECEKDTADELFERFGTNAAVYAITNTHFKADVSAVPGPNFFSWIFAQEGRIRILAPTEVRNDMLRRVEERMKEYRD